MNAEDPEVNVWYLFHSGFAIKTCNHFMVFDYYIDKPVHLPRSLDTGVIDPGEISHLQEATDFKVTVFSSHAHHDHFNPVIFKWQESVSDIRYVLSHDIPMPQDVDMVTQVYPGREYDLADMHITVLDSTDMGVAFLVKVDGITVYHAGDLNWWHWECDPESDNILMAENYKRQIDLLKDRSVDLAFVPMDPRLGDYYLLGMDYFIKAVNCAKVFPMHFGEDHSVFRRLENDARAAEYRNKIIEITHRGQHFTF